MASVPNGGRALPGCRILVVEDDYLIAQCIVEVLEGAGIDVVGPVASVGEARALLAVAGRIDAALLDVNVGTEAIWPVVDLLAAAGVPTVLSTGYDATAIPLAYVPLPRCEKPARGQDVLRTLAGAMEAGAAGRA